MNLITEADNWLYRHFPFLPSFLIAKGVEKEGHRWNVYGFGFMVRRKEP